MQRRQFLFAASTALSASGVNARRLFGESSSARQGTLETDPIAGPAQGPWRRLFLDAAIVERSQGVTRTFHTATKSTHNPVVRRDKPWEGVSAITGPYVYGTVMWQGDTLRMWYQFLKEGNHVAYAESQDGIHWKKPNLGMIRFEGSRENNIVVSAFDPEATGGQCHNPSVIRSPNPTDPDSSYVLYGFDTSCGHPRAAFSADGLRWRYVPESRQQGLFRSSDVVNFAYDPYQSRYFATWKTRNRRGRAVGVAWSQDGLSWTKPIDGPVFVADDLDPDTTQIYGMPVFPYQGLYVGLPWIYHARYFRYGEYSVEKLHEAQADSPRTMDAQLSWSWDLVNWTRPARREPIIPRGAEDAWDSGMVVTARAPVQVGDQLYFYYGGCRGVHDQPRVQAGVGLATLRIDGFCSMVATDKEGSLVTRREPFREPRVTINAKTKSTGWITAEIVDRHDKVVPGFGREECFGFQGDSVQHELEWKSKSFGPDQIRGDYKLRFWLKDAELFSYLPASLDPAQPDLNRISASCLTPRREGAKV